MSKDMLDVIEKIRTTEWESDDLKYLQSHYLQEADNNNKLLDYGSIYEAMLELRSIDPSTERSKREIAFCCIANKELVTNNYILKIIKEIKELNEKDLIPDNNSLYARRYAVIHAIEGFVSDQEVVKAAQEKIRNMPLDKVELMYTHRKELPILFAMSFKPESDIDPQEYEKDGIPHLKI